ncbi:hypothetical protein Taro_017211 [Colocasia esculenta]|uniref:Uncharacterized protein n=1 Tax=Colocasia esculenta TaxID=4460 RepID=A0A843UYQ3_COLES|nr:hypothetical protein [Colocasia esculenta]
MPLPPLPVGHPTHHPPPPPPPQQQQQQGVGSGAKRKKWTEEEERSLIDKYEEMMREGALARMKTREKRFRPIAAHVNATHHAVDPVAFPFQWSWKDASTKVQNMRHQYLLVKQKLLCSAAADGAKDQNDLPWEDGLSLWANFLRYKHVFGDVPIPNPGAADIPAPAPPAVPGATPPGGCFDGSEIAMDDDVRDLGLGFDCDGDDGDEEGFDYEEVVAPRPPPLPAKPPVQPAMISRKKRRKKAEGQAWAFLESQIARLKEREALLEERDAAKDGERQRREQARTELEEEREQLRQRRRRELEEEWEERWRRRQEEERRWEERAERRRLEWKKSMEGMLNQHRVEMDQLQARVLHVQQSMITQVLGLVAQWPGPSLHPGGLSDNTGFPNPHNHHHQVYVSQMMQSMHHVSGIVHGDNRVDGESQDDQFIVDDG